MSPVSPIFHTLETVSSDLKLIRVKFIHKNITKVPNAKPWIPAWILPKLPKLEIALAVGLGKVGSCR